MEKSSPSPAATDTDGNRSLRERVFGIFSWLGRALREVLFFFLIVWASLAIHYSNLPWPSARSVLAILFFVFAIHALWIDRRKNMRLALLAGFSGVVVWFVIIPPSNDRPWRPEVERPPRVLADGDRVRLINYRNFVYRSRNDFDIRYEERDVDVSRIVSVDLLVSYWKVGPVAHTFLSFNLDDGSPPVCISIETRPEVGEGFDPLASMFKQFELIYVVGDERDLVRVRTDHRDEDVFLYRLRARPEGVRDLFRIYIERINSLADRPEWYHLLSNSCTINVIRYSRRVGGAHRRFEIKHFLNGWIDAYLYGIGVLDTSLGFEELRRRSHINEAALAAGDAENFSALIRRGLPDMDDEE
jgi:hypothetical protein